MKTPIRLISILTSLLAVLLFLPFAARAQSVPPLVNYQGRLSNPDGSPLPTADYQLTFNIYDSATNSGGLVWGPQIFDGSNGVPGHGPKIPVVQGYFNVMLGPTDTNGASLANAFNDTNRFVEITVATNKAISPRQQILTVPFAFNSAKLGGYDWSSIFGTNSPVGAIPGAKIQAGTITSSQIAPSTITLTNLAPRTNGQSVGVGGLARSPAIGLIVFSGTPFTTNVTNLSVTIQTTGRPVFVSLQGQTNNPIYPGFSAVEAGGGNGGSQTIPPTIVNLTRSGSVVGPLGSIALSAGTASASGWLDVPPASFHIIDFPPAGTWTYGVQITADSVGGNNSNQYVELLGVSLVAFEL